MWFLKNLAWLVTMVLVVAFFVANHTERITGVNLLWQRWINVPAFLALFIAFVAGMLVAFILSAVQYLRGRAAARRLTQQVKDLKEELAALRNLPLADLDVSGNDGGDA
jgi:uncharacterized integral membrane protein